MDFSWWEGLVAGALATLVMTVLVHALVWRRSILEITPKPGGSVSSSAPLTGSPR